MVLGLTEVLARHAGRLAFYRPFIASVDPPDPDIELIRRRFRLPQSYVESYALTGDDLHDADDHDALLKRILDGYARVASGADVVVVEGSDFTEASLGLELALNLDAANHLGCPVLLVVGGGVRSAEQLLDARLAELPAQVDLAPVVQAVEVAQAAVQVLDLDAGRGDGRKLLVQRLHQADEARPLRPHLGRPVVARRLALDDWRRAAQKIRTPSQIELMLKMYAYYDRHGLRPGNPGILAWLLGRRPTTYAEFVARTRDGNARSSG